MAEHAELAVDHLLSDSYAGVRVARVHLKAGPDVHGQHRRAAVDARSGGSAEDWAFPAAAHFRV